MPIPKSFERTRYNNTRTPEEKIAILEELEQAKQFGKRGDHAEILRRHNITTAHVAIWKRVLKRQGKLPERLMTNVQTI